MHTKNKKPLLKRISQCGQSTVELALCMPILLGLCALGFDLGTTIVRYHRIATISREAAQVGSQIGDSNTQFCPSGKESCFNVMERLVQNRVRKGLSDDLGMTWSTNLSSQSQQCRNSDNYQLCYLSVRINVPTQEFFTPAFNAAMKFTNIALPQTIAFTSSALTRMTPLAAAGGDGNG